MNSLVHPMKSPLFATALVMAGLALVVSGYWGPWVWAEPVGLRVLGLDLAEYVKFVTEVQSGQVSVLREVFYLPLVALSLSLSLLAHRREIRLPLAVRWLLNLLAIPVALAMLPPAWTPALLLSPEFIKQTAAIAICVLAAGLSYPLWSRAPEWLVAALLICLALLAVGPMLVSFRLLSGPLHAIYGRPPVVGRGPVEMTIGFAALCAGYVLSIQGALRQRQTGAPPRREGGVPA